MHFAQLIIKVGCSWAALILSIFDMYGEGDFDFTMGWAASLFLMIWRLEIIFSLELGFRDVWTLYLHLSSEIT